MWTVECQRAFELIKDDLTKSPVLNTPNLDTPFKVQTAASDVGLVRY